MRNKNHSTIAQCSRGFTIIELMIATVVFSVITLVVTMAILQMTRVYYKGITEATTQNTARQIMGSIAQGIQFNGGAVTPPNNGSGWYVFCAGNQRYTYRLDTQLTDASAQHVLVQDSVASCDGVTPAPMGNPFSGGLVNPTELLAPHMRLLKLDVSSIGINLYKVNVRVAYGDDDLLTSTTDPNATCVNQMAGTQFCAISELTSVVSKRVQ
jgi:prepilin-type N-terminal cleavage/methylation domain-containing protein